MFMFKDVEKMFTEKVAQYIANGYLVNATTMAGHQGEICKLDLRKGDEVVRILIDMTNKGWQKIYYLLVGKNTDVLYGGMDNIIWNKNLQEIERHDFYVISDRYPEKSFLAQRKRQRRLRTNVSIELHWTRNIMIMSQN